MRRAEPTDSLTDRASQPDCRTPPGHAAVTGHRAPLNTNDVIALQRVAGNGAVQRLLAVQREEADLPNPLVGLRRNDGFGTPKTDPTRDRVRKLQQKLNSKQGLSLATDGALGELTLKALQSFMTDIGKSDEETAAVGDAGIDRQTADALMDRRPDTPPGPVPFNPEVESRLEACLLEHQQMFHDSIRVMKQVSRDLTVQEGHKPSLVEGAIHEALSASLKLVGGTIVSKYADMIGQAANDVTFLDAEQGTAAAKAPLDGVKTVLDTAIDTALADTKLPDTDAFFDAAQDGLAEGAHRQQLNFLMVTKPQMSRLGPNERGTTEADDPRLARIEKSRTSLVKQRIQQSEDLYEVTVSGWASYLVHKQNKDSQTDDGTDMSKVKDTTGVLQIEFDNAAISGATVRTVKITGLSEKVRKRLNGINGIGSLISTYDFATIATGRTREGGKLELRQDENKSGDVLVQEADVKGRALLRAIAVNDGDSGDEATLERIGANRLMSHIGNQTRPLEQG